MRLAVTGGRKYGNTRFLAAVLDQLHHDRGISVLIEGGAEGTDKLARLWAEIRGVPVETYAISDAEWAEHGNYAGSRRNGIMHRQGKPEVVVAFPGGRGTRDMVERTLRNRVELIDLREYPGA